MFTEKNAKISHRVLIYSLPSFHSCYIFYFQGTLARTKTLTLVYYYKLNFTLWILLVFSLMSSFCSKIQFRVPHCTLSLCPIGLHSSSASLPCFFYDLDSFGQISFRKSPQFWFVWCFSHERLGLWNFSKNSTEGKSTSDNIISGGTWLITSHVNRDHLLKVMSPVSLLLRHHFSHSRFLGNKSLIPALTSGQGLMSLWHIPIIYWALPLFSL